MMELDERLRPIAKRPVGFTGLIWMALFKGRASPLDEAGIRPEAEGLLEELLDEYGSGEEAIRAAIRGLLRRCPSFAWAATLPYPPGTEEGFRRHLLLFSIRDQGRDSRDAILLLQDLCQQATEAGIDPAPILREIAQLSSDENKYGMGSTRELLLKSA
jgi:hypothetical protein